jgi:hypothetical protein
MEVVYSKGAHLSIFNRQMGCLFTIIKINIGLYNMKISYWSSSTLELIEKMGLILITYVCLISLLA